MASSKGCSRAMLGHRSGTKWYEGWAQLVGGVGSTGVRGGLNWCEGWAQLV